MNTLRIANYINGKINKDALNYLVLIISILGFIYVLNSYKTFIYKDDVYVINTENIKLISIIKDLQNEVNELKEILKNNRIIIPTNHNNSKSKGFMRNEVFDKTN